MKRFLGGTCLAGTALFMAIACGGGDDELTKAIKELRSRDLSIMVLTQEEWGNIASDFEVDTDSGPQDNEAAAEDTLDPDDDADDFTEAGREAGYELAFDHPNFFEHFQAGEGVLSVRSEVELFGTAEEAKAEIERKIAELAKYEGEDVEGIVVGPQEEFDVSIEGHHSGGLTFSSSVPALELTAYSTVVWFRIDRLVASVVIGAADDADIKSEAEAAARKLEERIRGVALGEIDEEPVEIPQESTDSGDGSGTDEPPPGVPDLAQLALRLDDLPDGFVVEEEGFEPAPETEFSRRFEVGRGISVAIGGTETIAIQHTVSLFEGELEARLATSAFEAILEGGGGRDALIESLGDTLGDSVTVREFRSIDVGSIGDQTVVMAGAIETTLGDFAVVFTAIRVDATVSLMHFTALARGFEIRDFVPLLQLGANRIAAGP